MKKQIMVFLAAAILLSGCATPKEFYATGGSRSDGTVKLSYEYGGFEKPIVDPNQGAQLAASKCAVWGYTGAEAFGAAEQSCVFANGYGCQRFRVTVEYQCTGSPSR